jgi:hypothetical protein
MLGPNLIQEARAAGLQVTREGDELVIRGPRRAAPLARQLLDHKVEIMLVLDQEIVDPQAWRDFFEERAAIRQHDGAHRSRPARLGRARGPLASTVR